VSEFFNSNIVQDIMEELADMQKDLIQQTLYIPYMNIEQKKSHLKLMKDFLDKQKLLFFRMTLSDDVEAQKVKVEILKSAQTFGIVNGDSTDDFFNALEKTIDGLAKILNLE
jgi:hypothetical protein